jgi:hypothetical protein
MASIDARLAKLEAACDHARRGADLPSWDDTHAAMTRLRARAPQRLTNTLEGLPPPDEDAESQADAALIGRWYQVIGVWPDVEGARARLTARLAIIARRLEDVHDPPPH